MELCMESITFLRFHLIINVHSKLVALHQESRKRKGSLISGCIVNLDS